MAEETEKRNSTAGFTTRAQRSARQLIHQGGYMLPPPDPELEAKRARVRQASRALIRDLGGDPSKAQTVLARNAAAFCVWLEDNEDRMLSGAGSEAREYINAARACMQMLQALGIERKPRDVMTLNQYLKEKVDDTADDTPQSSD